MNPTLSATRQALGLAGWLALSFATAALGAVASVEAGTFYSGLDRPGWAPPGWLFAPVWSTLFTLMAVAAWLVWRRGGWRGARIALALFCVQLAFNALWSWLFFVWRQGGLAFADAIVLAGLIGATVIAFWRFSRLASVLMIPYLAWVVFACALTYAVWRRNPGLLG